MEKDEISHQDNLDYTLHKAGLSSKAGEPLGNCWPYRDDLKLKEAPKPMWFVDIGNNSVGRADSLMDAQAMLKVFPGGQIRPYSPTLEEIDKMGSATRIQKRYENCF